MPSKHTLSRSEIMMLPAGRIMNTYIEEYVMCNHPYRWSNLKQAEVKVHWFEDHPRVCEEDAGGFCSADGLPKYSTDISASMSLLAAPALQDRLLTTKTVKQWSMSDPNSAYWATFYGVPVEDSKSIWAFAPTVELAVCRAALLAV